MATIGELNVLLKLKGANQFEADLKGIQRNLTALSQTFGQVEKASKTLGLAITGTFTAAFAVASKSLPQTDAALKDFKKSTEELSKTLAVAATPALKDLTLGVNKLSNALKEVNPEILNNSFKFGLALLAVAAFSKTLKTLIDLLRVSLKTVWGQWSLILTGIAISIKVITDSMTSLQQKLRAFATGGFAGLGALFTGARGGIFSKDFSNQLNETTDALGRFVRGFKDHFKTLAENAETFGRSVAQSLEDAFSNTLFDAITGRLKGLRSILTALGEDILRSGIRSLTNSLFGAVTKGFSFGKKDPLNHLKEKADEVSEKFGALSINMDRFAAAKDRAIEALQRGSGGGVMAGPVGFAAGTLQAIPEQVAQSATALSGIFAGMSANVAKVNSGILAMGSTLVKVIFGGVAASAAAQAIMVGLAAVSSAIITAITVAAAGTIAAAWAPAALFASIATLGGAAGIGSAALGLATATLAPIITGANAISKSASSSSLPAGANITMGAGGIEGLAEGGIVRKPGIFMVGESGPEAVIPLNEAGSMGGANITINSDFIFADDPSQVDRFVRKIKDGLLRASNRRTGGTSIAF